MRYGRMRSMALLGALRGGALCPSFAAGQALDGTGLVATGLLLRRMEGVKRVLMIGAHPDDENTTVLAQLSRGMGAETAYLSLTRGEGGQNLLGPELWDGLGIIRTGELEAARRLDGGRQFFTRAFDYGFSKTAEEAFRFWPREELVGDVVWVIRTFRPQVVISVFSGTPQDGHGHHQAAGVVAREAFAAAGDPLRFPEQLARGVEPWAPTKLYGRVWRGTSEATVSLETGAWDPLLGRSILQLAMESRSFHRSQDMGTAQPLGPQTSGMRLERTRTGAGGATGQGGGPGGDDGVFAGVDTTLAGAAAGLPAASRPAVLRHLDAYRQAVSRAREAFGGEDPFAVVEPLGDALAALSAAEAAAGAAGSAEWRTVLAGKTELARRARLAAAGVTLELRAADDQVTPAQTVQVTAYAWNGGPLTLGGAQAALALPSGWTARQVRSEGLGPDASLGAASMATWVFEVSVPAGAALSRLYHLRQPRDGAGDRWPGEPSLWGLPRDPAPVMGRFSFSVSSAGGAVAAGGVVPWSYVGVNPARGEFREPVLVVPAVSAEVTPRAMVWPQERSEPRTLTVEVRSQAKDVSRGTLRLEAPAGWGVTPGEVPFEVPAEGGTRSYAFAVRPTGAVEPGEAVFRAEVTTDAGTRFDEGFTLVDYEHVERAALFSPAASRVAVVPVRVAPGLRVGYIMGTGDDGPEAIRQLGAEVTLLGDAQVRAGDFKPYDVVVVGVRAYEARDALRAANGQLLDFARGGGTVLVQYNQYDFPRGGYTPYPVEMARPAQRVTEEDAEVRLLDPDAPVFTTPNRIGPADFDGWVQERGLYFLSTWDAAYTPLLEMHDQGEEPTRGSLVVAPVGRGLYVYAALSFFRQWESGVPGAYRLWANLLSLTGDSWRAYRPAGG
ncbi:MAG: PIG-L family deacetylase [Gemmatimonadetes bacterium]|nr:PIG-L family deacetylase [Gemmatimonadota bacterium]